MTATLEKHTPSIMSTETDTYFSEPSSQTTAFTERILQSNDIWENELDEEWFLWLFKQLWQNAKIHQEGPQLILEVLVDVNDFREAYWLLLHCPEGESERLFREATELFKAAHLPTMLVKEVLQQSATSGGPDGLDIGIDFLSQFGSVILQEAEKFLEIDFSRWSIHQRYTYHVNDDVWYILLRALAQSDAQQEVTFRIIERCARDGTRSIREAATHSLADFGDEKAEQVLTTLAKEDPDQLVRESAQEELNDWESFTFAEIRCIKEPSKPSFSGFGRISSTQLPRRS